MRRPALLLLLLLCGCNRGFFTASGSVASTGRTYRNDWKSTPQGCTRDPFDAQPGSHTSSILTFVWQDPGARNPLVDNRTAAPDAPMRLGFYRSSTSPAGYAASLETLRQGGIRLTPANCPRFFLRTEAHTEPNGQPSLSGEFELDCNTAIETHIAGHVTFAHCQY